MSPHRKSLRRLQYSSGCNCCWLRGVEIYGDLVVKSNSCTWACPVLAPSFWMELFFPSLFVCIKVWPKVWSALWSRWCERGHLPARASQKLSALAISKSCQATTLHLPVRGHTREGRALSRVRASKKSEGTCCRWHDALTWFHHVSVWGCFVVLLLWCLRVLFWLFVAFPCTGLHRATVCRPDCQVISSGARRTEWLEDVSLRRRQGRKTSWDSTIRLCHNRPQKTSRYFSCHTCLTHVHFLLP